jgi:hypothetical protein
LSAQAHIRHETVQQQLDELRHRVEQLESQH